MTKKKNNKYGDIRFSERSSYIYYGFTIAAVEGIVASFLTYFYTDIFMLSAGVIAALFLTARIFDSFSDPVIGFFVDKTNTRFGKFRPYVAAGVIGMSVFGTLTFIVPSMSASTKIIWAFISYISFGITQTMTQLTYMALPSVMTNNSNGRTNLLSSAKIFATIGTLLAGVMVDPMIRTVGGGNEAKGILITVVIIMALQLLAGTLVFIFVKERVKPSKQKVSLKNVFPVLTANKPGMVLIVLRFLRKLLTILALSSLLYYVKYNLGSMSLMKYFMLAYGVAAILGIIIMPMFSNNLGRKWTYIIYSIIPVISGSILYFSGTSNVLVAITLSSISSMFMVAPDVLSQSLLFDTLDYGEWKTGVRTEGLTFTIVSFANKIGVGAGGAILVMVLEAFNYVGGAQIQSEQALNGIVFVFALLPSVLSVLCAVIMAIFFKFDEEEHDRILSELEQRKS